MSGKAGDDGLDFMRDAAIARIEQDFAVRQFGRTRQRRFVSGHQHRRGITPHNNALGVDAAGQQPLTLIETQRLETVDLSPQHPGRSLQECQEGMAAAELGDEGLRIEIGDAVGQSNPSEKFYRNREIQEKRRGAGEQQLGPV